MIQKITTTLFLTLILANCGGKNEDHSKNDMALLLALQPQGLGISGIYASLNARSSSGGGQGFYSTGNVSPYSLISQSQDCSQGGKMTLTGDLVMSATATTASAQFNDAKTVFESCKQTVPLMEGTENTTATAVIEGEILRNGQASIVIDPTSTAALTKATGNATERIQSSTYKVNGYLYPKFDITFTKNNAKLTLENMNDIDKAYIGIEETVQVTGTIGTENLNTSYTYKSRFKLR
ncbi:sigma factor SigX-regulated lipoprotein [Leptospira kmetyi]|uniref:sigma factor SigX-regulated lipoprotein n=1 Tax=Leptospira kmetyi TaxID=408139 RepID=UPI00028955C1|nr:hypothetical protein [Leptospira kmetyi]EQA52925.1 hypothetical protein LEP1GSC052_2519 [Leptospira kmetyi serovar Malaysia str. Bejo-Iso9]